MSDIRKTVLHDRHEALGARMVDFGGWHMPVQYPGGILEEHLSTRKGAGLFDVSHMGRFVFRGSGVLAFLQHVLTNNAAALDVEQAQYTIIPNASGGAVDDAYLYRFREDEYLLVVNASNARKDWEHFESFRADFADVELVDRSEELAMLALQGPRSRDILAGALDVGALPEPRRNALSCATIGGTEVLLARTGYTGEPLCFELFIPRDDAPGIWDLLIERGAHPVGLGARDTLRLEAGLPLYGHELGTDGEGKEIPIFACPLAKFAVSFSPLKGEFVGKAALTKQHEAFARLARGDDSLATDLPRVVVPVAVTGKAVAREGTAVFRGDGTDRVGTVTSGTMVPYSTFAGEGLAGSLAEETQRRAICLALLDSRLREGDEVQFEVRGRRVPGVVVPYHLRSEAPPYARPIVYAPSAEELAEGVAPATGKVRQLLGGAIANTRWRQSECINLIPSEQTASPMVRLLSVMDPAFRYAEHRSVKAFEDAEVFYYQGTDFICEVERRLAEELAAFLGCRRVETRLLSGQMANTAVFSALVNFLNVPDRRSEPRRIRSVLNNDIMKGGHLSAQPMGALKDFVARDPRTEKPAVFSLPVLPDNPYKADVAACRELIEQHRPELIILGKSMVLHPEPVAEIRSAVDEMGIPCVIHYDMAHVLGLVGPHFQEPFREGADLVTGSTHKTFFGTQRGIIGGDYDERDARYGLWEAIESRTFPGSVSNHHLGTMLGLLMAAYEMNHFKDEYQQAVLANAKALARALADCGLNVAGDPAVSYTETHQVVLEVGYARGPELARRLEASGIIVNYQAGPEEEGFTAAGGLRLGVAEMTRFGMQPGDFETVAQLIRDVIAEDKSVVDEARALRSRFVDLRFCFSDDEYDEFMQELHSLI